VTGFLAILISGIGTYASRALFILALANRRLPPRVTLAMEYVGPSVMAALVVTLLLSGEEGAPMSLPEAVALAVAALLAWKTRNHLLTLGVAMSVYWGLRALL